MATSYTVALINAIPTPVTIDSGSAITAARNVYNTLSDTAKPNVTNYSTLTAAEAAYQDIVSSAIECVYDYDGKDLTISNTIDFTTSKGSSAASGRKYTAKIDGVTYTGGLKMESATTVTFTTTKTMTLSIYVGEKLKIAVDGTNYDITSTATENTIGGVLTIQLSAGNHTISRNSEQAVIYKILLS